MVRPGQRAERPCCRGGAGKDGEDGAGPAGGEHQRAECSGSGGKSLGKWWEKDEQSMGYIGLYFFFSKLVRNDGE